MSLPLYMDENVPFPITIGLRARDVDVLTVQEDGLTGASDPVVFYRAVELKRLVFSQDQDFLVEAKQRQMDGTSFPGVVFASQLKCSIGQCVQDLELIVKVGQPEDFADRVQFLPL